MPAVVDATYVRAVEGWLFIAGNDEFSVIMEAIMFHGIIMSSQFAISKFGMNFTYTPQYLLCQKENYEHRSKGAVHFTQPSLVDVASS